jgi:hypothetical protein
MKKTIFLMATLLCAVMVIKAQDAQAAPKIEIPLTAYISTETNLAPEAEALLLNRMRQAALKNGLSAVDNQPYIVTTSVNVIDKQLTGTVPQKWLVELEVHFFIGNGVDGTLYASTAMNRKGIGASEEQAYLNAIKALSANDRNFKPFFEKGKKRIIEELKALAEMEQAQQGTAPSEPAPADNQPLDYNFNWQ